MTGCKIPVIIWRENLHLQVDRINLEDQYLGEGKNYMPLIIINGYFKNFFIDYEINLKITLKNMSNGHILPIHWE